MKKYIFLMVLLLSFMAVNAEPAIVSVSNGDVYEIQAASAHEFDQMHFARILLLRWAASLI